MSAPETSIQGIKIMLDKKWKYPATILAFMALIGLSGCLQSEDGDGDGNGPDGSFAHALFTAQENALASFDLATGNALPGIISDVKSPTDMQALEDGTVLVNLSATHEILILDGRTMEMIERMPSSGATGLRPVHSFITPDLEGKRYWVTMNDGDGTAPSNSMRFLDLDTSSDTYLKPVGEAALGIGHHKAAFSPKKARVVVSNIADCDVLMAVFDFSDVGNIRRIAALDASGAGFDGSDRMRTCDLTPGTSTGIRPSPHGCAAAGNSSHALCNMTGNGTLAAVDLDAAVPSFKMIPTGGSGGGYTASHPGGRYLYSLQSGPREGAGGEACQVGQIAVVDAERDSLVKELPLFYGGPDCADSINGTKARGSSPSRIHFAPDGGRAYVNLGSGSTNAAGLTDSTLRVSVQLSLDVSDPADPRQLASIEIGESFGSHGEVMTGDGKWLLVANNKDGTVSKIDVAAGIVSATIATGNAGKTMATFGSSEGPGHQTGPVH